MHEINEAIYNQTPFLIDNQEVISLILRGQEYEKKTKVTSIQQLENL